MQNKDKYLSVVVPAYNEEQRIEKTLLAINDYLIRQPYSWEILVVSDGSRDQTVAKVSSLDAKIKNLRLIAREKNKGKGYTVREGMLASHGRIRLFTDADNSTDISHFEKMRPLFDRGYDVVICSRDSKDVEGASQAVSQVWYKRVLGNLGNLFFQLLAVRGIWDTQCGFKAFRDYAATAIFSKTRIDRWAFDVEALALARALTMKIGIVAAYWINDPKSHVSFASYLNTLWETVKIWWWIRKGAYNL